MAGEAPRVQTIAFNEALEASVDWLRKNWWRTLIVSAASFVVAWVWNMWLMAYRLEGHRVDPGRGSTTATADGKSYNLIYWLLVTTVGFGLIAYARERGVRNALQELAGAPKRMLESVTARPNTTIGMFLWGMSLSMIVAVILTQAMSGVLAVGFIVAAPSLFANLINNFFIRVWTAVLGNFAPQVKDEVEGIASPLTVMLGQAAGMVAAFIIGDSLFGGATAVVKVVLALGLAGLSYVVVIIGNRPSPTAAGVTIVVLGALGAMVLLFAHPTAAFADDGGWRECSYNGHACGGAFGFYQWFRSSGATLVIKRGFIGGVGAGFGAILGATLGGAIGSLSNALRVQSQPGSDVQFHDPSSPTGGGGDAGAQQPHQPQPQQGGSRLFDDVLPDADSRTEEDATTVGTAGADPGTSGPRMFDDVLPDADKAEDETVTAAGIPGDAESGVGPAGAEAAAGGVVGGAVGSVLGGGGAGGGDGGPRMFDDVLPDADRREDEGEGGGAAAAAAGAAAAGGVVGGGTLGQELGGAPEAPVPAPGPDPAPDPGGEGGPSGPELLADNLPDADKVEKEKKPRRRRGKGDGDRLV